MELAASRIMLIMNKKKGNVVCWFCRNYEHDHCNGYVDLTAYVECRCALAQHAQGTPVTRMEL